MGKCFSHEVECINLIRSGTPKLTREDVKRMKRGDNIVKNRNH